MPASIVEAAGIDDPGLLDQPQLFLAVGVGGYGGEETSLGLGTGHRWAVLGRREFQVGPHEAMSGVWGIVVGLRVVTEEACDLLSLCRYEWLGGLAPPALDQRPPVSTANDDPGASSVCRDHL